MARVGHRSERVAEQLRKELTQVIGRDLHSEELTAVVITGVDLSDDLGIAWVNVRSLEELESEKKKDHLVAALRRAAGRISRVVAPALRLRRFPELRFRYDEGWDNLQRVQAILGEIAAETATVAELPPGTDEPDEPDDD